MKKTIFIVSIFFFLLFSSSTQANIIISEVYNSSIGITFNVESESQYPNIDIVQNEVYRLSNIIPILNIEEWNLYIVKKRCYFNNDYLNGVTFKDNSNMYIFSNWWGLGSEKGTLEHVVEHELFHSLRFRHVSDGELQEYMQLKERKDPDEFQQGGYYDNSDEVFAEDGKWLFGTDNARNAVYHRPSYNIPSIKEKVWIANKIGYILTWQEKLEYYKIYSDEGLKEINRCGLIWNQEIINNNIKEAENAHNWANQIRKILKS